MKPFWIDHVDLNSWGKLDPETGRWDGFFGLVGYGAANDKNNDQTRKQQGQAFSFFYYLGSGLLLGSQDDLRLTTGPILRLLKQTKTFL